MNSRILISTTILCSALAFAQGPTPPAVTKAFAPTTIRVGGTSTLTLSVTNGDPVNTLTDVSFTDTYPAGVVNASPTGVTGSCTAGASVVVGASTGGPSISFSNGTLPPGGSCTFSINVVGQTAGVKVNSVTVSSDDGAGGRLTGNTATANLTVDAPPTLTKAFTPASVGVGGTSTITFTITNPNTTPLTNLAFVDTLPAGLAIANPPALATTCVAGTSVTGAVAGSTALTSINIPSLAGGASCTLSVNVVASALGTLVNVTSTITSTEAAPGAPGTATLTVTDPFQVRYASNLNNGDAVINITNPGANGASLNGPGFGGAAGNICVNVYAFSPDEQLVSCCSCLITPNGLVSLSVNNDLVSNTLTGVRPNSVVVKLVNTGAGAAFTGTSCTNSAALAGTAAFPLASGMQAWGTTVHAAAVAGTFAVTETPFLHATLSAAELASINNRCLNIIGNGSTFGICRSCRAGGLSSSK